MQLHSQSLAYSFVEFYVIEDLWMSLVVFCFQLSAIPHLFCLQSVDPSLLQGESAMLSVRGRGVRNTAGAPSRRGVLLLPKEGTGAPRPKRIVLHWKSGGRSPNAMALITVGVPEAMAEVPVQRGIAQLIGSTEALKLMEVAPARGTTGALLNMMMRIIMVLPEAVGLLQVLKISVVTFNKELKWTLLNSCLFYLVL